MSAEPIPVRGPVIFHDDHASNAVMRTTLYFDGSCPLCMRGVRHWRRLDWARRLDWVDLACERSALDADGVVFRQAMLSLHVRARDGRLRTGARAFATLWSELPGYRWLAWLLSPPWAMRLAERFYHVATAGRRARWCDDAACRLPSVAARAGDDVTRGGS